MPAAATNIKTTPSHIKTDMKRTHGLVAARMAMVLGETASDAPPGVEPYKLATGVE